MKAEFVSNLSPIVPRSSRKLWKLSQPIGIDTFDMGPDGTLIETKTDFIVSSVVWDPQEEEYVAAVFPSTDDGAIMGEDIVRAEGASHDEIVLDFVNFISSR